MKICSVEGCTRAHKARQYCSTHWMRWSKYGDINKVNPIGTWYEEAMYRFFQKVRITKKGCWAWTGTLHNNGYAFFDIKETRFLAHRFSYMIYRQTPKKGLVLDHLCRVRHCVNPDHLEEVTRGDNVRRGLPALTLEERIKLKQKDMRALI